MPLGTEPKFFKLLRTPGTDSTESIPCMELILGRVEGEGEHPAKLIPALKFNIYWTWPTRLHTYLVPTSVADPDPGSGAFLTPGAVTML